MSEIVIFFFNFLPFWHELSVPDPELEIGRGGGGHPDPYIRAELGPQFSLKIRGGQALRAPPLDPPLY